MKNTSNINDLSLSDSISAKKMTGIGLLTEYCYDIYSKIVAPVKSIIDEESSNNDFWHFAEVLSDEDATIKGFNNAIREVVNDIKVFTESLKKYALDHGGLTVAGIKIEEEISKILNNIQDIVKITK